METRTKNVKPLVNWLATMISPDGDSSRRCNNTFQRTEEYCRKWEVGFIRREKSWPIIDGIEVHACCDCEVIFNGPTADLGIEEPREIHHEDELKPGRHPDHLINTCRCCHKAEHSDA